MTRALYRRHTLVDEYEAEIDEFLEKVFHAHNAWISDDSRVSDFFGVGGAPKDWRKRTGEIFHIALPPDDPMLRVGKLRVVDIARLIRQSRRKR